jgi:hypothetical protein
MLCHAAALNLINACRHFHMMASLLLLQRPHIMHQFSTTNFETGELAEPDIANHRWLLQQLKLKPQQVSSITGAFACFDRHLNPIMQQRQQLQHEIAQQQEQPGSSSSSSGGGSSEVDDYKQRMAKREGLLMRLSGLLQKDFVLRTAACAVVIASMTYVQLAEAAVLMYPHPAVLPLLGKLLLEQQQQQQQQLLLQQQNSNQQGQQQQQQQQLHP